MGKYDDIIDLPHHVSKDHSHMAIENRAAQFAPFAALSGYGDSIEETGRLTCDKIELDEQHREALDAAIKRVISNPDRRIRIVYFMPDMLKDGGEYVSAEGIFKKTDDLHTKIILTDDRQIPVSDIYSISLCERNEENDYRKSQMRRF